MRIRLKIFASLLSEFHLFKSIIIHRGDEAIQNTINFSPKKERPSRRKGVFKYRVFFTKRASITLARQTQHHFFHKKSVHHTEGGVLVNIQLQENRVLCTISIQKTDLF